MKRLFILGILGVVLAASSVLSSGQKYIHSMRVDAVLDSGHTTVGSGLTLHFQTASGQIALGDASQVKSMVGAVIVEASSYTGTGFGLKDTCAMYLKTFGLGRDTVTLDSARATLPCTMIIAEIALSDTTFKSNLAVYYEIYDTTALSLSGTKDTVGYYKIRYELIGRD
jgi:hypothetical protein